VCWRLIAAVVELIFIFCTILFRCAKHCITSRTRALLRSAIRSCPVVPKTGEAGHPSPRQEFATHSRLSESLWAEYLPESFPGKASGARRLIS
jgi:hypothetical protein